MFFFFKRKTAYEMRISDWSSDVCSSDLGDPLDFGDEDAVDHLRLVTLLLHGFGHGGVEIHRVGVEIRVCDDQPECGEHCVERRKCCRIHEFPPPPTVSADPADRKSVV